MIEFIILGIAVLLTGFAISSALNGYFVKYGKKKPRQTLNFILQGGGNSDLSPNFRF